ncbi:hypothetical protein [Azospirillum rugosum]|uniref:Uncharacterized protein n=1 Tax=Azospirillum rugosum TaxID=416170 RepID=A0ABS4SX42_9PROT|nr:hypothetical protein [Azospirillum rugosum]MBP2297133.1 hypothetical protein [Azospirillum rugosum]MDQ0530961.1 hypothetical protein [Azospirillum rugosum]
MDPDRCHEIVAYTYLTADKGLFVNPQFPIYIGGKRHLPDFLAVEPAVQRVWLVEVSRSKDLADLRKKCVRYAANLPDVQAALKPSGLAGWSIGVWLILRADTIPQATGLDETLSGVALRTTSIEETVASWMWLNPDGITRTAPTI